MIETAPVSEFRLAPNVWLRQDEVDGQYVEIVMPPFELNDLIDDCVRAFPQYTIQVCDALSRRDPELVTPEARLSPEMVRGLFNTQVLGSVLARQQVRGAEAIPVLPELQQAFGLAMKGRLRLTADPVPDL